MIASNKNMPINRMESSCRPSPISNDTLRCDMNSKVPISIFLVAGFLMVSAPLFAHHGNAAYDDKAPVTIKGIVTDYLWVNPNDQVEIVHWACETVSPSKLFRSGWTRDSLKAGDQVTITAFPAKSHAPVGYIRKVVLANGKELGTVEQAQ